MSTIEFYNTVLSFEGKLNQFAYKLTSNSEDAKDLLHDTYYKAIKYKDKFADNTNIKAWLYTIMRNTFINNYRKQKKAQSVLEKKDEIISAGSFQSSVPESPEAIYNGNEIYAQIKKLDLMYSKPFIMYIEGYKYHEIAEEMNIPLGTVKSRIFLARKKIIKSLEQMNYV